MGLFVNKERAVSVLTVGAVLHDGRGDVTHEGDYLVWLEGPRRAAIDDSSPQDLMEFKRKKGGLRLDYLWY